VALSGKQVQAFENKDWGEKKAQYRFQQLR
jgi:hypothetical protein